MSIPESQIQGGGAVASRGTMPSAKTVRRALSGTLLLLGLMLLVWALAVTLQLRSALSHARIAQHTLRILTASLDSEGVPSLEHAHALRQSLEKAEGSLRSLDTLVGPAARTLRSQALWPAAQGLGQLICDGLELSTELATVAWWSAVEIESATEQFGSTTLSSGVAIEFRTAPLQQALDHLASHREPILRLYPTAERVANIGRDLTLLPEDWRATATLAPLAVNGLLLAPEMLGGDRERLFLVIIQNSDELRPTGGFISSVLALRMQGYRLVSHEYMNSYEVETPRYEMPAPPEPLATYMGLGGLVFRDGNWSPDFPTSAQVLASLFQASRGQTVDAVIAVDTIMLQRLLGALGPVAVESYGITITADNLLESAEGYWENPVDGTALAQRESNIWGWLDHRKDFGGAFVTATMARMQGMTAHELVRLLTAVDLGIQGRHLQAWALNSARAQEDLSRSGVSGGVDASPGDYLMVVDSNVGYNKVDRNIERSVTYGISLAAERPQVELQLTYHNRSTAKLDECINTPQILDSYEALTQLCYWDYVRILVPVGSELIEVQGADGPVDETSERGRLSLGTLLIVPPGETRTLTFRYRLPQEAIACDGTVCQYALTIQKQGGTDAVPFALYGDVEPQDLIASGWQSGAVVWPLSTTLQTDRKVTWRFERPVNDGQ